MVDPNRTLFESVVRLLAPVLGDLVFVGGCTTGLFITDPAAAGVRPTVDVDAIVDVATDAGYSTLAERLRALGLGEDTSPGAPMCRWRRDGVVVDVMPVDERILGFSNRWYPTALATARTLDLAGQRVRVVTPPLFVATKLEAFRGRGRGDCLGSHDLEDIVTRGGAGRLLNRPSPTRVSPWSLLYPITLVDNQDILCSTNDLRQAFPTVMPWSRGRTFLQQTPGLAPPVLVAQSRRAARLVGRVATVEVLEGRYPASFLPASDTADGLVWPTPVRDDDTAPTSMELIGRPTAASSARRSTR